MTDRIAEVTPAGDPHRGRRRAPRRRARPGHRLRVARLRRADGDRRRGRADAGRGLGGGAERLPGPERPRLPEPVPALRAEHERRHRLGHLHDRGRRCEHVVAALRELDRADARRIEIRREAAEAFDRELRAALAGTVWHTGCTNWYVDEHGNDPNQWPWTWSDLPAPHGAASSPAPTSWPEPASGTPAELALDIVGPLDVDVQQAAHERVGEQQVAPAVGKAVGHRLGDVEPRAKIGDVVA